MLLIQYLKTVFLSLRDTQLSEKLMPGSIKMERDLFFFAFPATRLNEMHHNVTIASN